MFSDNLQDLANSLTNYIDTQKKMIQSLMKLFKSNKCVKSFFRTTCAPDINEFDQTIQTKLNNIVHFSENNIVKLKSKLYIAHGKLSALNNVEVTDENVFQIMNNKLNAVLSPFYLESSNIFESTVTDFEHLTEEITQIIKDKLKGGKRRLRKTKKNKNKNKNRKTKNQK